MIFPLWNETRIYTANSSGNENAILIQKTGLRNVEKQHLNDKYSISGPISGPIPVPLIRWKKLVPEVENQRDASFGIIKFKIFDLMKKIFIIAVILGIFFV